MGLVDTIQRNTIRYHPVTITASHVNSSVYEVYEGINQHCSILRIPYAVMQLQPWHVAILQLRWCVLGRFSAYGTVIICETLNTHRNRWAKYWSMYSQSIYYWFVHRRQTHVAPLLKKINFNFIMDKCNRWNLGMEKIFHPTIYRICDYLSVLGFKLIHVCKRCNW